MYVYITVIIVRAFHGYFFATVLENLKKYVLQVQKHDSNTWPSSVLLVFHCTSSPQALNPFSILKAVMA